MKANRWAWILLLLLLVATVFQLLGQQAQADRKLFEIIKDNAAKGDAAAQYNLGICYEHGKGVAPDAVEAVKWYRKAAEQNDADAQFNLGNCYTKGYGVAKDAVEAVKWYRKAAEQNDAGAQYNLGICYEHGKGVAPDAVEAVKWYRRAAAQNDADAQYILGLCFANGTHVAKDTVEAMKWHRKAADQNHAKAQYNLGFGYANGNGVAKDEVEAVKWYRKAAEQNYAAAQINLGICYSTGNGVAKDEVEGYKWVILAAGQGLDNAKKAMGLLEDGMTRDQTAEGQKLARNFKPRELPSAADNSSNRSIAQVRPDFSGTGFFISEDGYLISNNHVVEGANQLRLVTSAGLIFAKVVKVDAANDLALLKAEGKFSPLPIAASRGVKMGGTVVTVGFPNIGLQGFAPKLAP